MLRTLQIYTYINHVKEQNSSLLITKNQNTTNSGEPNPSQYIG